MDWEQLALAWAQTIFDLAMPMVIVWATSTAVTYLQKRHLNTTIVEAVGRAAGAAFSYAHTTGKSLKDPAVFAESVRIGVAYLESRVPEALSKAGIVGHEKDKMVGAELGKQLALGGARYSSQPEPVVRLASTATPAASHQPMRIQTVSLSDESVQRLVEAFANRLRAPAAQVT